MQTKSAPCSKRKRQWHLHEHEHGHSVANSIIIDQNPSISASRHLNLNANWFAGFSQQIVESNHSRYVRIHLFKLFFSSSFAISLVHSSFVNGTPLTFSKDEKKCTMKTYYQFIFDFEDIRLALAYFNGFLNQFSILYSNFGMFAPHNDSLSKIGPLWKWNSVIETKLWVCRSLTISKI